MRIENVRGRTMMTTFFTLWGYEVSYLEFVASIVSFIGVGLGITGKRITWPWYGLSGALYGIFFLQYDLYASAALQLVFITAAIFGWFGWSASGAKPSRLTNLHRVAIVGTILLLSLVIAPLLADIGAAAAYPDTLLLLGSMAAQVLMVLQKYETWVLWFLVNIGYVALYATQDLLFTTVLYVVFTVMAVVGWKAWYESHRSALRSH
jgi:nicotinamide mononucleotide transporter